MRKSLFIQGRFIIHPIHYIQSCITIEFELVKDLPEFPARAYSTTVNKKYLSNQKYFKIVSYAILFNGFLIAITWKLNYINYVR